MIEALVLFAVALPPIDDAKDARGSSAALEVSIARLPLLPPNPQRVSDDWLVDSAKTEATAYRMANPFEIALDNGLVRETIRLAPYCARVGLDDVSGNGFGASILRAIEPEATFTLDGREVQVGGIADDGTIERAFTKPEWLAAFRPDPTAFVCTGFHCAPIEARLQWKRVRHAAPDATWPPKGIALDLEFAAPSSDPALAGVVVTVRHESYTGLPLLSKRVTLKNGSTHALRIDSFVAERLAAVEPESDVEQPQRFEYPNLHVETDYTFGGFRPESANQTVNWIPDPKYSTQVNYRRTTPNLLVVKPPLGPGIVLKPGESFSTFTTWMLVNDSTDRERKTLGRRRMMRALAPWVTENPILMHIRSAEPSAVKLALDQCHDVGFEMAILTFGSGFDAENTDPRTIAELKELADYAKSRGVELGGYSLLASRSIGKDQDVIDPVTHETGHARFGNSPCLESAWSDGYFTKLRHLFATTGFMVLEHDGSYPGDVCASTSHPGHLGLDDSQWRQWETIRDYYRECRAQGIYLNVPDWYFLNGSSKIGMGYRESNWSLPRDRQIVLGRQNLYDGTFEKTPSMGWMFVPLVEYQGGGAAATLEPLADHLPDYSRHFANLFGFGAQACFRGPRLYDSEKTRAMVKSWVDFFEAHRTLLESDVIHLRRADGRDLDYVLHVDPRERAAMLVAYNPTNSALTRSIRVPLHYAGLRGRVVIEDVSPFAAAPSTRLADLDSSQSLETDVDVSPDRPLFLRISQPPK